MQDFFSAAEKILFDIESVLKKNKNLQSFEIIVTNDDKNKSPVYHESNSLGLASWCVQPLYCYVYDRLIQFRRNKNRRLDPEIVSRWLLGVLLLNPDINTFWNMRREMVQNKHLDVLEELRFTKIILHRTPKCFEAFSYRRLLIKRLVANPQYLNSSVESLLLGEISVATISADRHVNNYHAWNHRQFIVLIYKTAMPLNFYSFLVSEWVCSEKWCKQHVSDYGGLSYRQFLLKQFFFHSTWKKSDVLMTSEYLTQRLTIIFSYIKVNAKQCNEISLLNEELTHQMLDMLHGKISSDKQDVHYEQVLVALSYWIEDCTLNQNLISSLPGHESLWHHRRFLAYFLRSLTTSYLNYSCYQYKFFQPSSIDHQTNQKSNASDEHSKNLLEIAFENQNIKIMIPSKQHNVHQNNLINSFKKFLVTLNM